MTEINNTTVLEFIKNHPACKLRKILDGLEVPEPPQWDGFKVEGKDDWKKWYDSTYGAINRSLQELKAMGKIFYKKGKAGVGGWFLR